MVVTVYGTYDRRVECQELQVLDRSLARRQEVHPCIGLHRPVAVLAASVDAVERFLVENHFQMVLLGHFRHENHQEHVLVNSLGGLAEHRCALELVRSHLVMSCLARDGQLQCLDFQFLHKCLNSVGDGSEIMVIHLLVLGTFMAHQGASGKHQVGTRRVQACIHQKVLLLRAYPD